MIFLICRNFAKALNYGSKYIYQTMPRMLTLWLDYGEDDDQMRSEGSKQLGYAAHTRCRLD